MLSNYKKIVKYDKIKLLLCVLGEQFSANCTNCIKNTRAKNIWKIGRS